MTTMTAPAPKSTRKPAAKKAKTKPAAEKAKADPKPKAPRVTKEPQVIEMLSRPEGATVTELMELTGWQNHSVRGFISGAVKRKLGLTVERITEDGRTTYRIPSVPTEG